MTREHRAAPFPAVAPRLSLRLPTQQPSICAADTASDSYPLRIFMHIRANHVFHNAFVFNWMQVAANASLGAISLSFNTLRTLLSFSKDQAPYFHGFARSLFALLHKSENQLLCFHARARSFVNMWGWRAPALCCPPRRPRKQYPQPTGGTFCLPPAQFSGTLRRYPGGTR